MQWNIYTLNKNKNSQKNFCKYTWMLEIGSFPRRGLQKNKYILMKISTEWLMCQCTQAYR